MKILFTNILLIIILTSCTTTKSKLQTTTIENTKKENTVKENNNTPTKTINAESFLIKDNLQIKASLVINLPKQNNSITANIEIAGMDSILIKISAFLGVSVGQLYATANEFIMNNNFESTTYTGIPSESNIMKVAFIPLSYDALIRILKGIPLQNIDAYKYVENESVYVFNDENWNETIYLNNDETISKLVRKDLNENEIFIVEYSDYIRLANKNIAKKILIKFPRQAGNIEINYSDIQVKEQPNSVMRINKPKSYKLINIAD